MVTISKKEFKTSITYHYVLLKMIGKVKESANRKQLKDLVKQEDQLIEFIEKYENEALSN